MYMIVKSLNPETLIYCGMMIPPAVTGAILYIGNKTSRLLILILFSVTAALYLLFAEQFPALMIGGLPLFLLLAYTRSANTDFFTKSSGASAWRIGTMILSAVLILLLLPPLFVSKQMAESLFLMTLIPVGLFTLLLLIAGSRKESGFRSLTIPAILTAAIAGEWLRYLFFPWLPHFLHPALAMAALLISVQEVRLELSSGAQEKKMAAIGQTASSIVHDLKSTIAVIPGLTQIASMPQIDQIERKEILMIISESAKRGSDMCQNILAYSKGQDNFQQKKIPAPDFFNSILKNLQALFSPNKIELEYNIEYTGLINIDPAKMRRVILNIATNAKEAIEEAGTNSPRVELRVYKEKNRIVIMIEDNGPGIHKKIVDNIFTPFSTYGKSYGIGLGMAIVKDIVAAHMGEISFRTEEGKGTAFFIKLPE